MNRIEFVLKSGFCDTVESTYEEFKVDMELDRETHDALHLTTYNDGKTLRLSEVAYFHSIDD